MKRGPSQYDPTQPDKLWILESIAKVGIPLKVEDYEESLRNPMKFLKAKANAKKAAAKKGMPKGAIDKFVTVTKPVTAESSGQTSNAPIQARSAVSKPSLPPVYLAPTLENEIFSESTARSTVQSRPTRQTRSAPSKSSSSENPTENPARTSKPTTKSRATKKATIKPMPNANPWTIALSSSPTQGASVTKHLGHTTKSNKSLFKPNEKPDCFYSPPTSPIPHSDPISRKHVHSPHFNSQSDDEGEMLANVTMTRGVESPDQHLRTPSSSEKNPDRPSPRKKRSPQVSSAASSPTLASHPEVQHLSPEPVNRIIDFGSSASRDRSSSPELPALGELNSPRRKARVNASPTEAISLLSSSPEAVKHPKPVKKQPEMAAPEMKPETKAKEKKYIMLRDSLPGAWRPADLSELVPGKSRAWRMSQVEILDMTGD
jgi:Holliday junction resolvase YEN1